MWGIYSEVRNVCKVEQNRAFSSKIPRADLQCMVALENNLKSGLYRSLAKIRSKIEGIGG
jgi:hypothetical protein